MKVKMDGTKFMRGMGVVMYAAYFLFTMYTFIIVFTGAAMGDLQLSMQVVILAMFVVAGLACWVAGTKVISTGARNAIWVATALYVVFTIMNYETESMFHIYSTYTWLPDVIDNTGLQVVIVGVRMLFLIAGAGMVDGLCEKPVFKSTKSGFDEVVILDEETTQQMKDAVQPAADFIQAVADDMVETVRPLSEMARNGKGVTVGLEESEAGEEAGTPEEPAQEAPAEEAQEKPEE